MPLPAQNDLGRAFVNAQQVSRNAQIALERAQLLIAEARRTRADALTGKDDGGVNRSRSVQRTLDADDFEER